MPIAIPQTRNLMRTAEAKADEALIAKLELMRQIVHVRRTEDVPAPHIGQEGLLRLSRAIQSDLSAQNELFRTHNVLNLAAHELWAELPHDDTDEFVEPSGSAAAA
jgi:hypothetical protein